LLRVQIPSSTPNFARRYTAREVCLGIVARLDAGVNIPVSRKDCHFEFFNGRTRNLIRLSYLAAEGFLFRMLALFS
jgi:hypothetical protein